MNRMVWRVWRSRSARAVAGAAAAAAVLSLLVPAASTRAAVGGHRAQLSGLVQARPATGTPHFPARTSTVEQVRQLVRCGGTMYAVGRFSLVEEGGRTFRRN